MQDTSKLENKAIKPKKGKSEKDLERERYLANRNRPRESGADPGLGKADEEAKG